MWLNTGLSTKRMEYGQQQRGVKDALGVGDRAFGQSGETEALAGAPVIENIFDASQSPHVRIPERHQMGNDQVIKMDIPIAMSRLVVQVTQLIPDEAQKPAAHDLIL
jgi:hypothetical protein